MGRINNLIGKTFGRLTVIGKAESYVSQSGKHRDTRWICKCSCGKPNPIIVTRNRLLEGVTKSCGCYRAEVTAEKNRNQRKINEYDLSGEYGVGYTSKGEPFWFDKEDYEKVAPYCWHYDPYGYLASNTWKEGKRIIVKFHHVVFGMPPEGMVCDHIIHPEDPLAHKEDNRKRNLRFVTKARNAQNQVLRRTNTSGHKGVSWNKNGCWSARISSNGVRYCKYFPKNQFNEACAWYDEMAEKLHGEYRYKAEMTENGGEL